MNNSDEAIKCLISLSNSFKNGLTDSQASDFNMILNVLESQSAEIKSLTNTNKSYKGKLQEQGNDISRLQKEIERLREYEYMYKDLCD